MIGILTTSGRISSNQFKGSCLKKHKPFVELSLSFWNIHKICNIMKKKDVPYSLNVCKIIGSKRRGCLNVKKVLFRNTLWQSTY